MKTVRIGPIDYHISKKETLALNGREMLGMIDMPNCLIEIKDKIAPDHERLTLWHEILHAMFYQYQIPQDDEEVEALIEKLAFGLKDLVEDNPWLAKRPN